MNRLLNSNTNIFVLIAVACLAAVLQCANLFYLTMSLCHAPLDFSCSQAVQNFTVADADGYLSIADEIDKDGFFRTSYLKREPGYPLLLILFEKISSQRMNVIWIIPFVAAIGAVTTVWIAGWLAGLWAGVGAGLIFCLWPDTYRYSPLIMTDALHGFLTPAALAVTLLWIRQQRLFYSIAAGSLWALLQLIRPTFFPIGFILPALLYRRKPTPSYLRGSIGLCALTLVVPILLTTENYLHDGVLTPSDVISRNLALYTVPRVEEELQLGSFGELRERGREQYMSFDQKTRMAVESNDFRQFVVQHPWPVAKSFFKELETQELSPSRPYYLEEQWRFYPRWMTVPSTILAGFWLLVAVGLVLLLREKPELALFMFLLWVSVMVPAMTSHLVEGRLRFPVDLLAMPIFVYCCSVLSKSPYILRIRNHLRVRCST